METNTYYETPDPLCTQEAQNDGSKSASLMNPASMNFSLEPVEPTYARTHSSRLLTRRAENEATSERYRAQLSQVAMTNTAALSALETQITAVVPNAAPRCKTIVDMYALSASARISRW